MKEGYEIAQANALEEAEKVRTEKEKVEEEAKAKAGRKRV